MILLDWISGRVFNSVHRNNLVYNTCWEDPRLDREALDFQSDDRVMVITSAGCNALDYALTGPAEVHAVDMNPRQNALLELKIAAIKELDYPDFFKMFGVGRYEGIRSIYEQKLRKHLCTWSQDFWDRRIKFFDNSRKTFYYRGTSGSFARMIRIYVERVIKVREPIDHLFSAKTVEEQQRIYREELKERFWTGFLKFAMNRDTTLSMLGVPKAQRRQIELQYEGGVVKFIQDCLESVFTKLPIHDNYFWRVYLYGSYTQDCCPEYLKQENYEKLRDGLADRVQTHTTSVQGFLEGHQGTISKFILLDHMDWLSDKFFPLLESEWQAIVDTAAPNAKIIWRSGGLRTDFIDQVKVSHEGKMVPVNELLEYNTEMSERLHKLDRVHTYASFYIAKLLA
jgi:S-adenosylmethionine-diacylglycerol 3-amino-3-carboxypropyl transferase